MSASVRQSGRWEGVSHSGTLCCVGKKVQVKIFAIASQKRVVLEARDPKAEEVIYVALGLVFLSVRGALHIQSIIESSKKQVVWRHMSNSERDKRWFSRLCFRARPHVKGDPVRQEVRPKRYPTRPAFEACAPARPTITLICHPARERFNSA